MNFVINKYLLDDCYNNSDVVIEELQLYEKIWKKAFLVIYNVIM